jgi:4-aminobutyrate aminotransferase-like enzyme
LLGVLEEEDLIERARTEGSRLIGLLKEALSDSVPSARVRGRGMFIGIDLGSEPPQAPSGSAAAAAASLLHDGILVLPAGEAGEVIEITPPFTISRPQVDWCVEAIARRLGSQQVG